LKINAVSTTGESSRLSPGRHGATKKKGGEVLRKPGKNTDFLRTMRKKNLGARIWSNLHLTKKQRPEIAA